MTRARLKWLAVLAPLLFLGGLELVRQTLFPAHFTSWPGYLLLGGANLLGTLFFAEPESGYVGSDLAGVLGSRAALGPRCHVRGDASS